MIRPEKGLWLLKEVRMFLLSKKHPIVRLNCGDSHESSNGTPRIASQSAYLLGFLTLCALLPRSVPISWPSWKRCRSMPGHARREFREHEKCSSGPCCSRRSDWPAINGRTSSRSNASSTPCTGSNGHPLRHDLHHGGELSLLLGTHGLTGITI